MLEKYVCICQSIDHRTADLKLSSRNYVVQVRSQCKHLPLSESGDDKCAASDSFVAGYNRIPSRARSVDRDSDLPESLLSASPSKRMNSSVDSIPDSGMGTIHQSEKDILQERIQHLERQLKVCHFRTFQFLSKSLMMTAKQRIKVVQSNVRNTLVSTHVLGVMP